jgi:CubicO group peptidase (beta-lactamase class C family)
MSYKLLWSAIFCFLIHEVKAQPPGWQSSIDSLFAQWQRPHSPGVALAVVQGGKLRYSQGYGMANIKRGESIDSSTRFWIASTTKQFTAAGIYLLEAQKQLHLQHSIRQYLPQLPHVFQPVTLYHLLHHTSGIRDGFVLTALSKKGEDAYTNHNVLTYLQQQEQVNFEPGTEYEYNNGGYVLLALVIEKVAQTTFPEFLHQQVFLPLDMRHTYVSGHYEPSEKLAEGYSTAGNSTTESAYKEVHFMGDTYGSTGVLTTTGDLARWAAVLQQPERFPKFKGIVAKMLTPGKLNNGQEIGYGGGLETFSYRDRTVWEHFGTDAGFKANLVYFPSSHLSIIGLSNSATNYELSQKLYAVADVWHQEPKPPFLHIAEGDQPQAITYYYSKVGQPLFRQVRKFDKYVRIGDTPDGYAAPYYQTAQATFQSSEPIPAVYHLQEPNILVLVEPYGHQQKKLQPITPITAVEDLDSFTGTYYAAELETSYRVITKDNRLLLEFAPGVEFPLFRINQTDFVFDYVGSNFLEFTPQGFRFSREGCRRLQFKKQ